MRKPSIPCRLQLSLVLVIGAALLKQNAWPWLGIYGGVALLWCIGLRTPLKALSQLLGAELILLALLALPMGTEKAGFLLLRSLVCLLTMNSFLLTLPPHSFAIALKGLPLPAGLQEIALLAGQYLEVLLLEVTRMQRSAALRGLGGPAGWLRYASAAMIGALYLRSLDRAERVYGAMIVRGYNGMLPVNGQSSLTERFYVAIFAMVAGGITFTSYWQF